MGHVVTYITETCKALSHGGNIFSFKKLSDGIIFILKYFFCVKGQKKPDRETLPSWAALEGEATAQ